MLSYLILLGGSVLAQQEHTEITPVYNGYRHVITYDARNNKLSDIEQEIWNDKWIDIETDKATYNAANKVTWSISQVWQNFFTYDSLNNLKSFTKQYRYDSVYVNTERHFYTYSSKNEKTSEIIQEWSNDQWVNKSRSKISHEELLNQNWDGKQWVNSDRRTYAYDTRGNVLCQLSQRWDGKQWINVERWTYTFDDSNKQQSYIDEVWDGSEWGPWQPVRDPMPHL